MLKLKKAIFLGLVLALAAQPVAAQSLPSSGPLEFKSAPTGTPGPYVGAVPGHPTIDIYCVDFFHYAPSRNNPVNYNFNSFSAVEADNTVLQESRWGEGAFEKYKKAAYLTTFFAQIKAMPATQARQDSIAGLHSAIWHLFDSSAPTWSTADDDPGWFAVANAGFASYYASHGKYWYIASDALIDNNDRAANGMADPIGDGRYTKQEYLVMVTPEPTTIFLMGTGLLGVGLIARRRRMGSVE